jgi:poly(hydroxyalkanoate) depolymerase family esterase
VSRRNPLLSWALPFHQAFGSFARAQVHTATKVATKVTRDNARKVAKAVDEHRRPPKGPGDWLAGLAMAPGGVRRFNLYRPPGVGHAERLPLMVMLHGCQQDAKAFAESTRMNALAARERFLVLYPEQDRHANGQGCWNWYEARSGVAKVEARILMAAVQQACLLYQVDPARVAVAGLSAGASMAALLATTYPERFRAVAMHSGVPPGAASSPATALRAMRGHQPLLAASNGAAWPPLIVIHGGADRVVSSRNAETTAQWWAGASGARPTAPREVQRGKRHAMTVTDYKLRGRTMASLCEVGSLGHAWSGGAAKLPFSDARGPDASRLVWAFASRQFGGAG